MSPRYFQHFKPLLKLALPITLSTSAITLLQLIDALILSHYSSEAVAAIGPSGMAVILFQGMMFGTAGYAGTFVAHNFGRKDAAGVRSSAWLGIYTALFSGLVGLLLSWPVAQLFFLTGHAPQVAQDEYSYFMICMAGSLFPVLGNALAGWLSGIGRPVIVTAITFFALGINAVLDWVLVLGKLGLPAMGISGAALATVASQVVAAILYLGCFQRAGGLGDKVARKLVWSELKHFLTRAMPMGFRISGELAAWTIFLIVVGRLGTVELAASSIAFRINGTAFFPALGLGQAAGILVGHARGAGRDDDVPGIAWQSLVVCEIWMLVMALVFVLMPEPLIGLFAGNGPERGQIIATGTILMYFVAFYCLFDAANVMVGAVLAACGDTGWLARAFFICTCIFIAALILVDYLAPGLWLEWVLSSLFVFSTAVLWTVHFMKGSWRRISVLERG